MRNYAEPSWRDEGLALMASALRSLLASAPAGSDHQLAYVRSFSGVATSEADLSFLSGLLDGTTVLDGLAVDTDLRWTLLRRLVSRGVPGRGGDRRGAVRRRHRRGRAAGGGVPGGGALGHGEAGNLGDADRREADDRDVPRHAGRVRRSRPGRRWSSRTGRSTSPPSATCGGSGRRPWRRTSWRAATRSAPSTRRRSRRPTPTWRRSPSRPRRCAGCSTRAATRCCAPSATRTATARQRLWSSSRGQPYGVSVDQTTETPWLANRG